MDNQSAMAQICSTEFREASKHIQVRYYWLKETAKSGYLKFSYIRSGENLSDLHTKGLTESKTSELRRMAGMMTLLDFLSLNACPTSSRGGVEIHEEPMLDEIEHAAKMLIMIKSV